MNTPSRWLVEDLQFHNKVPPKELGTLPEAVVYSI